MPLDLIDWMLGEILVDSAMIFFFTSG